MEEVTYLSGGGVSVTSSRIQIGSQTFATRNVGSVRIEEKPRPSWPLVVAILGALMMISADARPLGTVLLLLFGAIYWLSKPSAALVLLAGGGEVKALESKETARIHELHSAIVQAISAR